MEHLYVKFGDHLLRYSADKQSSSSENSTHMTAVGRPAWVIKARVCTGQVPFM